MLSHRVKKKRGKNGNVFHNSKRLVKNWWRELQYLALEGLNADSFSTMNDKTARLLFSIHLKDKDHQTRKDQVKYSIKEIKKIKTERT